VEQKARMTTKAVFSSRMSALRHLIQAHTAEVVIRVAVTNTTALSTEITSTKTDLLAIPPTAPAL
jgi:hypothetical protein